MSETARMLGPESPFSNGPKKGEGEQFTRDVYESDKGRKEIDAFRFARYVILGWIRASEYFPYYELTVAGGTAYSKYFEKVRPKDDWGWDDDD